MSNRKPKPLTFSALRLAYQAANLGCRYRLRGPISGARLGVGVTRQVESRTTRERRDWAQAVAAQRTPLTPKMISALAYALQRDQRYVRYNFAIANQVQAVVHTLRRPWVTSMGRQNWLETDAYVRGRHVSTGWPAVRRALEAKGLMTSSGTLTDAGLALTRDRLLPCLAVCAFAAHVGVGMGLAH